MKPTTTWFSIVMVSLAFVGCGSSDSDTKGSSGGSGGSGGSTGGAGGATGGSGGDTGGSGGGSAGSTGGSAGSTGGSAGSGGAPGLVVGAEGVQAFDQLSTSDQDALKQTKVFFLHMSVGGNLLSGYDHYDPPWVAGTNSLGYVFDYVDSPSSYTSGQMLGEQVFGQNGDPIAKIEMFQDWVGNQGVGGVVKVAGLKFCYSDLIYGSGDGQDLNAVQQSYASMMSSLKGTYPAVSFFHVTPPLQPANEWQSVENNNHRKAFGDWLKSTYGSDVIFDLEAVESTAADGSSCTESGALVLCDDWKGDNDGHLSDAGSTQAAKAFLYALHLAAGQ